MKTSSRGRKTICLPIDSPEQYQIIVEDLEEFRPYLDEVIKSCPELLPPEILLGYCFYETNYSKKQELKIRRIGTGSVECAARSYTIYKAEH